MYSGRLPFNPFGSRGPGIFMILKKFFILGQRRNKATKKSEKVKNILSFLVSLWERNDELWNFEALLYGSTHISKVFKCLPLIKLMTLFPYWFARFATCKNESNVMQSCSFSLKWRSNLVKSKLDMRKNQLCTLYQIQIELIFLGTEHWGKKEYINSWRCL